MIGVAVGSGLAARAAEQGGADFLLAINAGRMRNMGAPSVAGMLPIMDADAATDSFAVTEVLSQTAIPVFVGVNVFGAQVDPAVLADRALASGFAGVVNFPSSMHYPTSLQRILERGGRGIAREVEVLSEARKRGLKTLYYCANRVQARLGADARLDMILLNFGWNTGGVLGHKQRQSLEEAGIQAREIGRFIQRIHPGVQFLLEGGPIVTSGDLSRVLEVAPLDGYVGGSTIERFPLENSIADQIASYRLAGDRQRTVRPGQEKLVAWGKMLGYAGRSEAGRECLSRVHALVRLKTPVLIQRESGTDVSWIIRAFEAVNPEAIVQTVRPETEDRHGTAGRRIFGTSRAGAARRGALGDPACRLLVIHDPEKLSPRTQARLARALSEGRYIAPGSRRMIPVSPRCICITDIWVEDAQPVGLDPNLAAVLRDWHLFAPPLRYRLEDLEELMDRRFDSLGLAVQDRPALKPSAIQYLRTLEWAGNEMILNRLVDLLAQMGGTIDREQMKQAFRKCQSDGGEVEDATRSERTKIMEALWRNNFHRGRTAEALGISRKTLYNKTRRYGLID